MKDTFNIEIEDPLLALFVGCLILLAMGTFTYMIVKGLQGMGPAMRNFHRCFLKAAHQLGMEYRPHVEKSDAIVKKLQQFPFTSVNLPATEHSCGCLIEQPLPHNAQTWNAAFINYTSVFRDGHGANNTEQTILHLERGGLELPAFCARPESISSKVASWFGFQDIDFAEHPEFSRSFTLKAKGGDRSIRAVFSPEVIAWFEAHPRLSVESSGNGSIIMFEEGVSAGDHIRREEESHAAVGNAYRDMLDTGLSLCGLFGRR